MLEPILLPKLQIYFAEFPYDPYIHAIAKNLGYLMRSRYDYHASFSSGQLLSQKMLLIITIHISPLTDYAIPVTRVRHPSQ